MTESGKKKPEKRIDFVLAVKEENLVYIQTYVANLKALGFEVEESPGTTVDLIFIKISIMPNAIVHFAELYDIGIEDPSRGEVIYTERIWRHPFRTPVSEIDRKKKGEVTNAERIIIADKVLQSAKYGTGESEYGLAKLMRLKIVQTAYPLHDGTLDDDDQGPPNDRKLLLIHWSNLSKFHKEQPLDLIHKYFGVEVAFYFAWLEYFNLMLLLPALVGFLVVAFALLALTFESMDKASVIIREVCNAKNIFLCPTCEKRKVCRFEPLSMHCVTAKLIYIFDNHLTIYFALFMSIWATLFTHLWKRKESSLKIRWNCSADETETQVRQQYMEKATQARINRITGEIDYYIPFSKKFPGYLFSFGTCFFLILIVAGVVIALIPFKIWFSWQLSSTSSAFFKKNSHEVSMTVTAIVKVCFMKLYAKIYGPSSLNLTKIENPRTLLDFDNSVMYKRFLLSFANNFSQMTYLSLLKGRFYSIPHKSRDMLQKDICPVLNCVPGPSSLNLTKIENPRTLLDFDNSVMYKRFLLSFANNFSQMTYLSLLKGRFYSIPHKSRDMLQKDICPVLNCVPALTIQIFFILTCKDLVGNLLSALIPACKRCFHRRKRATQVTSQDHMLPQWEEEYYLEPVGRYFLLGEFMEMVIKYGLITFYAAAFPLGPLCAIVNNTFELRGDAYKLVRSYRRPIPVEKTGIGAWNGILLGMTYTSIAMSAFVLCFTSSNVTRLVYYFRKKRYSFSGFVENLYAPYNTSAYPLFSSVKNHQEQCYVKNFYHVDEVRLYQLNRRYWIYLTWKLVAVISFENVVFVISILLMYIIPKYPATVVEQLEYKEYQNKMARIREADGGKDKTQQNKTKSLINISM